MRGRSGLKTSRPPKRRTVVLVIPEFEKELYKTFYVAQIKKDLKTKPPKLDYSENIVQFEYQNETYVGFYIKNYADCIETEAGLGYDKKVGIEFLYNTSDATEDILNYFDDYLAKLLHNEPLTFNIYVFLEVDKQTGEAVDVQSVDTYESVRFLRSHWVESPVLVPTFRAEVKEMGVAPIQNTDASELDHFLYLFSFESCITASSNKDQATNKPKGDFISKVASYFK